MRLPAIRHVCNFIETNDKQKVYHAIEVLENFIESRGIKENELDVIGELLSNMYGGLEVYDLTQNGKSQKDSLNEFMKKVTNLGR